jgi:hypothetical protein
LGFDETTIGWLAARGHLSRFTLTEPQIRARLYRRYIAYLLARAGGESGVDFQPDEADGGVRLANSRSASGVWPV